MSAPPLACAALEIALNRYLALEPDVLAECGTLDGRCIELAIETLGWSFFVEPHVGGVRVAPDSELTPDVRVRGPLTPLLRMAFATAQGRDEMPRDLSISGDTELLDRFSGLLRRVGFDPEELVAKVVGDDLARRTTDVLRGLFGWGRRSAETLSLDTADYLREETGDLVHRADVEQWLDAVDAVRSRADRLDARLRRFESRVAAAGGT